VSKEFNSKYNLKRLTAKLGKIETLKLSSSFYGILIVPQYVEAQQMSDSNPIMRKDLTTE